MLIAEGRVQAERSSRYLLQLCRHVDKAGQPHPQLRAHVEWSDDRGRSASAGAEARCVPSRAC
jgi:hypothetical protein